MKLSLVTKADMLYIFTTKHSNAEYNLEFGNEKNI